jgi:hypothetical protein
VLERWDKVLAVNLPVARERVELVDVARELGAGEFYSAVRTFSDRTMQFAVDKVRVQASGQDDMKLKVEAAEMIVDGKWFRSVCVEGRSKLGVRRLAENHVVRSVSTRPSHRQYLAQSAVVVIHFIIQYRMKCYTTHHYTREWLTCLSYPSSLQCAAKVK